MPINTKYTELCFFKKIAVVWRVLSNDGWGLEWCVANYIATFLIVVQREQAQTFPWTQEHQSHYPAGLALREVA